MAESIINLKLLLIPHLKVINNSCFWSHVKVKFFLVLIYFRRKIHMWSIWYESYFISHFFEEHYQSSSIQNRAVLWNWDVHIASLWYKVPTNLPSKLDYLDIALHDKNYEFQQFGIYSTHLFVRFHPNLWEHQHQMYLNKDKLGHQNLVRYKMSRKNHRILKILYWICSNIRFISAQTSLAR